MRKGVFVAGLLLVAPLAGAQATTVAFFLTKAEAAQHKGVLALLTSDGRAMMAELRTAMTAIKAERAAAQADNRRPAYCPTGKAGLSQKEILAAFHAVPPADRARVEVKDALRAALARKYPCGG